MAAIIKRKPLLFANVSSAWRAALQQTPTGLYTPSTTLTTNLDSATGYSTAYTRIADRVIVSGYIEADATAAAGTLTELRIDKPIASDLTSVKAGGAGVLGGFATPVFIGPNAATDLIRFLWVSPTTAVVGISFIFQYEVV